MPEEFQEFAGLFILLFYAFTFDENVQKPVYDLDEEKSPVNLTLKFLDEDFPVKEGSKKHQE